ncbi:glycosyltransferase [Altibacter sp. HG106]|uniref:glycosyltransferase n=1 Tax=Altibacter sp. HG106 TaxID=3023937 RepID=UPI002350FE79|nr:glycosyltransferase [Altibacter sp. HG106]MDC7995271.1 glycosyltransferase [Altibacter sp. HG106]
MNTPKTILVAPLHWGLGHATRCIPIIRALLERRYRVVLASDGEALTLLRKEFPELKAIELPAYNISYTKKGGWFKFKMLLKLPHLRRTIKAERKVIKQLISSEGINGIISDNRLGVRDKRVPSVFITHQLQVLSGSTSFATTKIHQKYIRKFDQCWVPDAAGPYNLSGTLGHVTNPSFPVIYMGPLSRMKAEKRPQKYDYIAVLSGPEPQRTLLEEKLISVFKDTDHSLLLVQGKVAQEQALLKKSNIRVVNYLQTQALEKAINESACVIARSGYTTIMDLASLRKDAFLIPTPGQYEQKYLAKQLRQKGMVPSCSQDKFSLKQLNQVAVYKGFHQTFPDPDFDVLFGLFKGK